MDDIGFFYQKRHLILHSHLSLRFFVFFLVAFLLNLVGISSSVKARKKIIRVFFHRVFCEQQNFSKSVSYVDLPQQSRWTRSNPSAPQPPPLASFFPRRSDPGKLWNIFVDCGLGMPLSTNPFIYKGIPGIQTTGSPNHQWSIHWDHKSKFYGSARSEIQKSASARCDSVKGPGSHMETLRYTNT